MRKLVLAVMAFIAVSCNCNKQYVMQEKIKNEPIMGAGVDEHGCKSSAGYRWSELKGECLHVFNSEAIHLEMIEQTKSSETVYGAFILFKGDKAELFVVGEQDGVIMQGNEGEEYKAGRYVYKGKEGVLYIDEKGVYKLRK